MATRVWDAFLTEEDRAAVRSRPVKRMERGEKPALLLVDLYRGVFGDEPQPLVHAVEEWPASCGLAGWAALPMIQRLLEVVRQARLPVIHVTGDEAIPHWRKRLGRGSSEILGRESPAAVDRRKRRFDIVDEVAPLPEEPVLRKSAPSAFWGTPLAGYLNQLRVDTVIVVGESTSGCVRATVVDGCSHRFDMVVVEECVFDRNQAAHAINLFDMDQKYADVISVGSAVDLIRVRSAASARAVGVGARG